MLFALCLIGVAALFLPYMAVSYKMYENARPKRPEGYPWFEFSDLKITLVSGMFILCGKKLTVYLFYDMMSKQVKN